MTVPQLSMVQDMTIQEMTTPTMWVTIWYVDASVHNTMGYNFILNAASMAFHYTRDNSQEDMMADNGEDSLGLSCWNEHLFI